MTFNTGNPVPSTDARDLYDNAQNMDKATNGTDPTWTDRLGVTRKSWAGMEQEFLQFLADSGFEMPPLEYVDGTPLQVLRPTQAIQREGQLYRAKMPATFPVGLSGVWADDQVKLTPMSDDSLRQELATAAGAGAIGFSGSETYPENSVGAAILALEAQASEIVTPEQFPGDDAQAIRQAISSLGGIGGQVYFPTRGYDVAPDTGATACIPLSAPTSLIGTGGVYSSINPAGVADDVDTISYVPDAGYDHSLVVIERLHLGNPNNGTRDGRAGLKLTTLDPSQNLAKLTVRDMIIGQGTGPAIHHQNDPVSNPNGGLFCARFENCQIKGGVLFESSGDSNTISNCVLTGDGIGVNASLVAGASLLAIENNNITASGGAIRIDAGSRFRILGNNIEHYSAGASDGAVINIAGANATMNGGVICENLISAFGGTDATRLLRLSNCQGTLIENNVFQRGVGTVTNAIVIDADCVNVRVGANVFSTGWSSPILDNGIGTMGVLKTASLQNGWVSFTASETINFIKSIDGLVTISGSTKDGTTTNGTLLFTLPPGFRPGTVVRTPAYSYDNAGTTHIAQVLIDTDGSVLVYYAHSGQVSINCSFPAALLANVESNS